MIKFKRDEDQHTLGMIFKFYGKKPGKPPIATVCRIRIITSNIVISEGVVRVVPEYALPITYSTKNDILNQYGKRVKKIYKADKGRIAILRGDQFCYETGKLEALKKALNKKGISKSLKKAAMNAYFEDRRKREEARENNRIMKLLKERGIIENIKPDNIVSPYEPF